MPTKMKRPTTDMHDANMAKMRGGMKMDMHDEEMAKMRGGRKLPVTSRKKP